VSSIIQTARYEFPSLQEKRDWVHGVILAMQTASGGGLSAGDITFGKSTGGVGQVQLTASRFQFRAGYRGVRSCIDRNQTKIVELLREVHLIAIKELERLNLQIAELENQVRPVLVQPPACAPPPAKDPTTEMMNEKQVADRLSISVGTVRRWRFIQQDPSFPKIGAAVRYRRADVETWFRLHPGR
jgi:hypothetical protein